VTWASDAAAWRLALDYRRWLVPLTFPFFLLALWEAYLSATPARDESPPRPPPLLALRFRTGMTYLLAAVYALVLGIQCTLWRSMVRRLMHDVHAYPAALVPRSAVPWVKETALDHWALPSLVTAVQGVRQEKVLLFEPEWEQALRQDPPRVPLSEWERSPITPGPGGWYDFRPFFEKYREEKPAGVSSPE
jgi:hypothetical protein